MDGLTFEADGHRYRFRGREVPGVNAVLDAAGLKQQDQRWYTEQAALRGEYAHLALAYLDAGELVAASVDPALEGYLAAYRRFLAETAVGPVVLNEARLCDPVLGYAGTVDRVRTIGGRLTAIDFKTGERTAWHGVQLAAYAALVRLRLDAAVQRMGLYLRADGTYGLHLFSDRRDWDVFRACLTIYQFQRSTHR
jgi:hypothetical protein